MRRVGDSAMCADMAQIAHPIRLSFAPGHVMDLHRGAGPKKVLLSSMGPEWGVEYLERADPRQPGRDRRVLLQELEEITERGWVESSAETESVAAFWRMRDKRLESSRRGSIDPDCFGTYVRESLVRCWWCVARTPTIAHQTPVSASFGGSVHEHAAVDATRLSRCVCEGSYVGLVGDAARHGDEFVAGAEVGAELVECLSRQVGRDDVVAVAEEPCDECRSDSSCRAGDDDDAFGVVSGLVDGGH